MGFFDALFGSANTVMTNASNERSVRETNQANLQAYREQNETNRQIAEINNAMEYKIASEANAFNRETTQMNNSFNAAESEKARQFEMDMWNYTFNRQNAYNDPSAQMERFSKAGINPVLAMLGGASSVSSGGSSGSGNAASSSNGIGAVTPNVSLPYNQSPPLQQAFQKMPYLAQFASAAELGNMLYGIVEGHRMDKATLEQMRKQNDLLAAQALNVESNTNWYGLNDYARDFYMSTNYGVHRIANEMNFSDESLSNLRWQNQISNAQWIGLTIQNDQNAQFLQKYFNPAQILNLNLQIAGIDEKIASRDLSLAQARNQIEQALKTNAEAAGVRLSNLQMEQLIDSYVKATKELNEYTFAFYNRLRGMIVPDDKINRAARISSILGNLFGVGSSVAGASTPFILRNMNKNIGLPSRSSHMYSVSPDFY